MIRNDAETIPREERRRRQDERLRDAVARVAESVPFYREAFADAGVDPDGVEGVDDLADLPFTTKEDLREHYPDGLFALPQSELNCLHASSGTTGTPKVVGYADRDLEIWREVMARSLAAAGVTADHTVQNAYGYGLFTGGLGFHYGCEELGATVLPIGGGNTDRQLRFLRDLGSEVLACTPSYALYLAERGAERGIDVADLPLSTVTYGAEPCTEPMRAAIEERLGATAVDFYGLSEVIGPGVAVECEARDGLHVQTDHFYPEVIDPETGEVLPPGEEGELVVTTLTKWGMPVVRYRTGDVTTLFADACDCGRTTVRMDNVTGRTDDMLVVRGANLYPSEVEAAALDLEGVAPHYRIDLYREGALDELEITVEAAPGADTGALRERVRERLEERLAVSPDEVSVVDPGGIERTETGKARRVYDHRTG